MTTHEITSNTAVIDNLQDTDFIKFELGYEPDTFSYSRTDNNTLTITAKKDENICTITVNNFSYTTPISFTYYDSTDVYITEFTSANTTIAYSSDADTDLTTDAYHYNFTPSADLTLQVKATDNVVGAYTMTRTNDVVTLEGNTLPTVTLANDNVLSGGCLFSINGAALTTDYVLATTFDAASDYAASAFVDHISVTTEDAVSISDLDATNDTLTIGTAITDESLTRTASSNNLTVNNVTIADYFNGHAIAAITDSTEAPITLTTKTLNVDADAAAYACSGAFKEVITPTADVTITGFNKANDLLVLDGELKYSRKASDTNLVIKGDHKVTMTAFFDDANDMNIKNGEATVQTFGNTLTVTGDANYTASDNYKDVINVSDDITITGLQETDRVNVAGDNVVLKRTDDSATLVVDGDYTVQITDFAFNHSHDFLLNSDTVTTADATIKVTVTAATYACTDYTEEVIATADTIVTGMNKANDTLTIGGDKTYSRTSSSDDLVINGSHVVIVDGFFVETEVEPDVYELVDIVVDGEGTFDSDLAVTADSATYAASKHYNETITSAFDALTITNLDKANDKIVTANDDLTYSRNASDNNLVITTATEKTVTVGDFFVETPVGPEETALVDIVINDHGTFTKDLAVNGNANYKALTQYTETITAAADIEVSGMAATDKLVIAGPTLERTNTSDVLEIKGTAYNVTVTDFAFDGNHDFLLNSDTVTTANATINVKLTDDLVENTYAALENYKEVISVTGDDQAIITGMQKLGDKADALVLGAAEDNLTLSRFASDDDIAIYDEDTDKSAMIVDFFVKSEVAPEEFELVDINVNGNVQGTFGKDLAVTGDANYVALDQYTETITTDTEDISLSNMSLTDTLVIDGVEAASTTFNRLGASNELVLVSKIDEENDRTITVTDFNYDGHDFLVTDSEAAPVSTATKTILVDLNDETVEATAYTEIFSESGTVSNLGDEDKLSFAADTQYRRASNYPTTLTITDNNTQINVSDYADMEHPEYLHVYVGANEDVLSDKILSVSGFSVYDATDDDLIFKGTDISGTTYDDLLIGGAKGDIIYGGKGDDTITGAAGDDELTGGQGVDTFVFNSGDGHDVITDLEATDKVVFNDVAFNGLAFTRAFGSDDLKITYGEDPAAELTLAGFFNGHAVEKVYTVDQPVEGVSLLENAVINVELANGEYVATNYKEAFTVAAAQTEVNVVNISSDENVDSLTMADAELGKVGASNDLVVSNETQSVTITDFNYDHSKDFELNGASTAGLTINVDLNGEEVAATGYTEYFRAGGENHDGFVSNLDETDRVIFENNITSYTLNGAAPTTLTVTDGTDTVDITDHTLNYDHTNVYVGDEAQELGVLNVKDFNGYNGETYGFDHLNIEATAAGGTYEGSANADVITGSDAEEVAATRFIGHAGNDMLVAGNGEDFFIFNEGDGQDNIVNGNRADKIRYNGVTITSQNLAIVGNNLEITTGEDKVTIVDYVTAAAQPNASLDVIIDNQGSKSILQLLGGEYYFPTTFDNLVFERVVTSRVDEETKQKYKSQDLAISYQGGETVVFESFFEDAAFPEVYTTDGIHNILAEARINVNLANFKQGYEATAYMENIFGSGKVSNLAANDEVYMSVKEGEQATFTEDGKVGETAMVIASKAQKVTVVDYDLNGAFAVYENGEVVDFTERTLKVVNCNHYSVDDMPAPFGTVEITATSKTDSYQFSGDTDTEVIIKSAAKKDSLDFTDGAVTAWTRPNLENGQPSNDLIISLEQGSITLVDYFKKSEASRLDTYYLAGVERSIVLTAELGVVLGEAVKKYSTGDISGEIDASVTTGVKITTGKGVYDVIGSQSDAEGAKNNDVISATKADSIGVTETTGTNKITTGADTEMDAIFVGDSNNTVSAKGASTIALGSTGTNKLTLGKYVDEVDITDGTNTVNAGAGNNEITINGGVKNTVTTGAGNDTIVINGGTKNIVKTGNGADEVTITDGDYNKVTAGNGTKVEDVLTGNTFTIEGGTNVITSGKANDTFTISGGLNNINGGAGVDTYDVSGMDLAEDFTVIVDKSGANKLVLGAEAETKTNIFFDVNKKGKATTTEFIFTESDICGGFKGVTVGVDVTTSAKNALTNVGSLEVDGASCHLDMDGINAIAANVAAWLADTTYKSAADAFANGTEGEVAALSAIYAAGSAECFKYDAI